MKGSNHRRRLALPARSREGEQVMEGSNENTRRGFHRFRLGGRRPEPEPTPAAMAAANDYWAAKMGVELTHEPKPAPKVDADGQMQIDGLGQNGYFRAAPGQRNSGYQPPQERQTGGFAERSWTDDEIEAYVANAEADPGPDEPGEKEFTPQDRTAANRAETADTRQEGGIRQSLMRRSAPRTDAAPAECSASADRPRNGGGQQWRNKNGKPTYEKRKFSDQELEALQFHDLARYARACGLVEDKNYKQEREIKSGNLMGGREWTMRDGSGARFVIVEHRGKWSFFSSDDHNGSIINFDRRVNRHGFVDAVKAIQGYFGKADVSDPTYGQQPGRTERTRLEILQECAARKSDPEKVKAMQEVWDTFKPATHSVYLEKRGIRAETQAMFAKDFRIGGPNWWENKNGIVSFAQRNVDGEIVGISRKGPKFTAEDKRDYSRDITGSEKAFCFLGETGNPKSIVICESAIDGMSAVQAKGLKDGVMMAVLSGSPSDIQMADLYTLAKRHPEAEIRMAVDNDAGGKKMVAKIEEAVGLARDGDVSRLVDDRPHPAYKDWNDQIRNREWTPDPAKPNDIEAWEHHTAKAAETSETRSYNRRPLLGNRFHCPSPERQAAIDRQRQRESESQSRGFGM
jgi:hypothetical protein